MISQIGLSKNESEAQQLYIKGLNIGSQSYSEGWNKSGGPVVMQRGNTSAPSNSISAPFIVLTKHHQHSKTCQLRKCEKSQCRDKRGFDQDSRGTRAYSPLKPILCYTECKFQQKIDAWFYLLPLVSFWFPDEKQECPEILDLQK